LAAQARGDKYADETPSARFREMDNFLDKAMVENKVSMSLTSKPPLTHYGILWTKGHYEDRKLERKLLSEGNRIDLKKFVVRYEYLCNSQTRWGGSLQEMEDCKAEAIRAGLSNPQLDLFDKLIAKERDWLQKNPWHAGGIFCRSFRVTYLP
jgi:hypothetical protein